jgi:FlaA1/EpsC-like NDP-sugar epimerase
MLTYGKAEMTGPRPRHGADADTLDRKRLAFDQHIHCGVVQPRQMQRKSALITGAGNGIGAALAKRLASQGFHISVRRLSALV